MNSTGILTDRRPEGARVTADLVGLTSERTVSWGERETMLYALGIGAGLGAPDQELALTIENGSDGPLRTIPSMLTILTAGRHPPGMAHLDVGRFLHGEQRFELFRAIPPHGEAIIRTRVDAVFDKGPDAVLCLSARLDERGGEPIGVASSRIFVRGGGGFGGERGGQRNWSLPDRDPDCRIEKATRPEQALLYRLSGDRNPLHADPAFAQAQGFPRPILHGLCTYGFACRALVQALCGGDTGRLRTMDGRFTRPVYPGDTLTTLIWRTDQSAAVFRVVDGSGSIVFDRGIVEFG